MDETIKKPRYNANTPFVDLSTRSLAGNNAGFRAALEFVSERPSFVMEAFGGAGSQTKIIQERWPGIDHVAYERDARTFETLQANAGHLPVDLTRGDYLGAAQPELRPGSLLILDFNNHSLLPSRVRELAWAWKPEAQWTIFCDYTRARMHLNYFRYGIERPDMDLYIRRVGEVLGRPILGWAPAFQAFSYFVIGPGK